MKRPNWNDYFMTIAEAVASRSTCLDKRVGCVLVDKDRHIIGTGYNGVSKGKDHCIDTGVCQKETEGKCVALHAEMNAISHSHGHPMYAYCTLEPCQNCAQVLLNEGVTHVYFSNYTNKEKSGCRTWKEHGTRYPSTAMCWTYLESKANKTIPVLERVREYHKELGYPLVYERSADYVDEDTIRCKVDERAVDQAREILLAINQEVAELTDSIDWKPWRAYNGERSIDVTNFLEEAGDVLFFLDSLLMNFGLNWEELFRRMDIKVDENYRRIQNGYHN